MAEPLPQDAKGGHRAWLAGWLFGVLILAAVIVVVLHAADFESLFGIVRRAKPGWLLLAGVIQLGTYVSAAAVWGAVLAKAGYEQPLGSLVPLGVVKLFTDQAVPTAGMSGAIILLRGLDRRGIPASVAMAALLVDIVSYYAAYLIVVLIGVGILWLEHVSNPPLLVGATVFTVVVVAIPVLIFWVRHVGRQALPAWIRRFRRTTALIEAIVEAPTDLLRDPLLLAKTTAYQFSIFLIDAVTLWVVFRALGTAPAFAVTFVSFATASAAATIGPLPLGLGAFEAASVATLHLFGVPLAAGLAATLLLRFLTFWLPMIPGLVLTRREIRHGGGATRPA